MRAGFVLDCSIAMAWPFHDEATPKTTALPNRLATETARVPAWWFIEITNVLAMAERKGRITRRSPTLLSPIWAGSESSETRKLATARLPIFLHCADPSTNQLRRHPLDLAIRRSLPLATLDDDLRRTAKKLGIGILG